jgi:hypothetical protein
MSLAENVCLPIRLSQHHPDVSPLFDVVINRYERFQAPSVCDQLVKVYLSERRLLPITSESLSFTKDRLVSQLIGLVICATHTRD